jgi:hypothetical protein
MRSKFRTFCPSQISPSVYFRRVGQKHRHPTSCVFSLEAYAWTTVTSATVSMEYMRTNLQSSMIAILEVLVRPNVTDRRAGRQAEGL